MKKIIIIGSSIAGASAACLLAEHCGVVVYEQKSRSEIGKKLCANVFTPTYLEHSKKLGVNPKKFIVSTLNQAYLFSEHNSLSWKTKEYKIDREKLVDAMIKRAQKNGAMFNFKTSFVDFEKKQGKNGYVVRLKKGSRIFTDSCDILIGADGASSLVAKKAGLWNKRELFVVMQTEVELKKLKKFGIKKKSYYLYLGRKRFGFYSYIFSIKDKAIIGIGDLPENVNKKFHNLLKFLKVKGGKIKGALCPGPKVIHWKKDLFLLGDAGCHIKFSGGGVVPSIMSAEAARDIIVNKNYKKIKELNRRTFFNRLVAKAIWKSSDEDLDRLIEIFKDKKFNGVLEKRDEFSMKEYKKALDLRMLKFIIKAF